MRRIGFLLLSAGLFALFGTQAMAVDVKSSGEYYAAGVYIDKGEIVKNNIFTSGAETANTSTAFFFQRLRLSTTFIVHPGLFLITRADIMERAWGANRSTPSTALDSLSAGTRAENENIAFDLCYLTYISPFGIISAGYQIDGAWGTPFGDSSLPTPKVGYTYRGGPVMLGILTGKNTENSRTAINNTTKVDRDSSFYTAYAIYKWKGGQAAVLGKYIRNATSRGVIGDNVPGTIFQDVGVKADVYIFSPYVKAQFGPVALMAQLYYLWGKQKWEGLYYMNFPPLTLPRQDADMNQLAGWIDVTADFGRFYVGGSFAYVPGDDPATGDKVEGGVLSGGLDWNPCLILWNNDMTYWAKMPRGYDGTTTAGPMNNAYFVQVRGGLRPIEKLDLLATVSWAHADKTLSAQWNSRDIGFEVDVVGTYKITNNLMYMLGGAYLFPGDWFKGTDVIGYAELQNNFLVINKLILTL